MTIEVTSKENFCHIIFTDKICNISQSSSGTVIGLVSGENIIVSIHPSQVLTMINSKPRHL